MSDYQLRPRKISRFYQRPELAGLDRVGVAESDWVWASPFVAGQMPYYTNAVQRDYIIRAAKLAGLGKLGWHDFRHTYRAWMGQHQTPLTVQKDLMRHADIKTYDERLRGCDAGRHARGEQ